MSAPAKGKRRKPKEQKPDDPGMLRLAEFLSQAHVKYRYLFGTDPHGTVRQMMAMLVLCPQAETYVRLFEKQREEGMTV